jgi:hypothetical protein
MRTMSVIKFDIDFSVITPSCRLCGNPLTTTFVDLGMSPPCEDF